MDTRSKIRHAADAATLQPDRPLLLVTGRFEVLRRELMTELQAAVRRCAARSLVVVVEPLPGELVPAAARAEMAAALRMVDYVFIAREEELDRLAAALQPIETIHLGEAEQRRTRHLIEHVQRRPTR